MSGAAPPGLYYHQASTPASTSTAPNSQIYSHGTQISEIQDHAAEYAAIQGNAAQMNATLEYPTQGNVEGADAGQHSATTQDPRCCSVRGCANLVASDSRKKMCEVCREKHRMYATVKRQRRKQEKAALTGLISGVDYPGTVEDGWAPDASQDMSSQQASNNYPTHTSSHAPEASTAHVPQDAPTDHASQDAQAVMWTGSIDPALLAAETTGYNRTSDHSETPQYRFPNASYHPPPQSELARAFTYDNPPPPPPGAPYQSYYQHGGASTSTQAATTLGSQQASTPTTPHTAGSVPRHAAGSLAHPIPTMPQAAANGQVTPTPIIPQATVVVIPQADANSTPRLSIDSPAQLAAGSTQHLAADSTQQPAAGSIPPSSVYSTARLSEDSTSPSAPADPAAGLRFCSVKGCKNVLPGDYEFKMCSHCREKYKKYGVTKRAKWKLERELLERELATLRVAEDARRKEKGLPPLADNPHELFTWEQSIINAQIQLPKGLMAVLEGHGDGNQPQDSDMQAGSIMQIVGNGSSPTAGGTSSVDATASSSMPSTSAVGMGVMPLLPVRMCTVSHCHRLLPGTYLYKRCEQHRVQNRHHSSLKRVREKAAKVVGPEADAKLTPGAARRLDVVAAAAEKMRAERMEEEEEELGEDEDMTGGKGNDTAAGHAPVGDKKTLAKKPAGDKKNADKRWQECVGPECCNLMNPAQRWRACQYCRAKERQAKQQQQQQRVAVAAAGGIGDGNGAGCDTSVREGDANHDEVDMEQVRNELEQDREDAEGSDDDDDDEDGHGDFYSGGEHGSAMDVDREPEGTTRQNEMAGEATSQSTSDPSDTSVPQSASAPSNDASDPQVLPDLQPASTSTADTATQSQAPTRQPPTTASHKTKETRTKSGRRRTSAFKWPANGVYARERARRLKIKPGEDPMIADPTDTANTSASTTGTSTGTMARFRTGSWPTGTSTNVYPYYSPYARYHTTSYLPSSARYGSYAGSSISHASSSAGHTSPSASYPSSSSGHASSSAGYAPPPASQAPPSHVASWYASQVHPASRSASSYEHGISTSHPASTSAYLGAASAHPAAPYPASAAAPYPAPTAAPYPGWHPTPYPYSLPAGAPYPPPPGAQYPPLPSTSYPPPPSTPYPPLPPGSSQSSSSSVRYPPPGSQYPPPPPGSSYPYPAGMPYATLSYGYPYSPYPPYAPPPPPHTNGKAPAIPYGAPPYPYPYPPYYPYPYAPPSTAPLPTETVESEPPASRPSTPTSATANKHNLDDKPASTRKDTNTKVTSSSRESISQQSNAQPGDTDMAFAGTAPRTTAEATPMHGRTLRNRVVSLSPGAGRTPARRGKAVEQVTAAVDVSPATESSGGLLQDSHHADQDGHHETSDSSNAELGISGPSSAPQPNAGTQSAAQSESRDGRPSPQAQQVPEGGQVDPQSDGPISQGQRDTSSAPQSELSYNYRRGYYQPGQYYREQAVNQGASEQHPSTTLAWLTGRQEGMGERSLEQPAVPWEPTNAHMQPAAPVQRPPLGSVYQEYGSLASREPLPVQPEVSRAEDDGGSHKRRKIAQEDGTPVRRDTASDPTGLATSTHEAAVASESNALPSTLPRTCNHPKCTRGVLSGLFCEKCKMRLRKKQGARRAKMHLQSKQVGPLCAATTAGGDGDGTAPA